MCKQGRNPNDYQSQYQNYPSNNEVAQVSNDHIILNCSIINKKKLSYCKPAYWLILVRFY